MESNNTWPGCMSCSEGNLLPLSDFGGQGAPIGETLDFHLAEVEAGHAVFEGQPGPHVYNPIGSVHGGYAATLLDSACGCAVHSMLRADQIYTTLELKTAYHRAMTADTGLVRAIGSIVGFRLSSSPFMGTPTMQKIMELDGDARIVELKKLAAFL